MKPEYMFGEPPAEPEFDNEQVKQRWQQARGELYGFAKALQHKSPITAAQLRLALQLAEQAFQYSQSGLLTACEQVMYILTGEDEESWQHSQAYEEAPYHFLWVAIRNVKPQVNLRTKETDDADNDEKRH